MTLLEQIYEGLASTQSPIIPSDYPIVLDPVSIFPSLNLDDSNVSSLVIPVTGWKISESDSELITQCKKFFTKLRRELKNPNNFGKEEFLGILNEFLEKISKNAGLSIGVNRSDNEYTRVLVQKVGSLMGKDVASLVLEACVTFEIWELVETLIINRLIENSCYSNLVHRLVTKKRADLLCQCIKHVSNLGPSELLLILKFFLGLPKNAYGNAVDVRKEWESQALLAMDKAANKSLSGKKSSLAKEAAILLMLAHDGFSSPELCLHYLLSSENLDEVVFASAIGKLNGEEMRGLITYLGKWLKKYERFPQAGPCPKASTSLGLKACDWVPKLEDVVKCIGLVLDENYSALVLHPEFHQELMSMNELVTSLALEAKLSCSVANIAEKVRIQV